MSEQVEAEVESGAGSGVEVPAGGGPADPAPDALERLEQEGEVAADYLEGLLDIADLDGDIDMDVEGGRALVSVVRGEGDSGGQGGEAGLGQLVGRGGEVLEALQELTRLAVHRELGERTRLVLDVDGYRERRRQTLSELGRRTAREARASGEPQRLQPMSPFERKIVHDAVAEEGLHSESEGVEPRRFVVVLPA